MRTDPKAKEYQRIRQKLTLFHLLLTPGMLLMVLLTPLSVLFREAAAFTNHPYGTLLVYWGIFSLWMLLADGPFTLYSGFVIEHRFKLSNQTLTQWFADWLKAALLQFVFSGVLMAILYTFIWNVSWWWLYAWLAYLGVTYMVGKLFPVFLVPLFFKYKPLEDTVLLDRIQNLCDRFKLSLSRVSSLDLSRKTKKANAAFMGFGSTKRLVLSDTLVSAFSHDEIESVVGHELGHFVHRDLWKQVAFGAVLSFICFATAGLLLEKAANGFGAQGIGDVAALPLLMLIFYGVYLIFTPIQSAFTRRLEYAADAFALEATKNLPAFVGCMEKLGSLNLADPEPHPVYEWFFYDHPSLGKRIRAAEGRWKALGTS